MDDVIVRLLDLPYTVHGFTSMDSDHNYNVYISILNLAKKHSIGPINTK